MSLPLGWEMLLTVALPQGWELLLIVAVVVLLFGAKRLPDAARGLGRSLRIFKSETKGLADSSDSTTPSAQEALGAQESKAVTSSEKGSRSTEAPIAESEER